MIGTHRKLEKIATQLASYMDGRLYELSPPPGTEVKYIRPSPTGFQVEDNGELQVTIRVLARLQITDPALLEEVKA